MIKLLEASVAKRNSLLCMGMDLPPTENMFPDAVELIKKVNPYVACYKFNLAFWLNDLTSLRLLTDLIHRELKAPVILDGKFGDIYNTTEQYAKWAKKIGIDAVTVNPYMGLRVVDPFINESIFPFVLTHTTESGFLQTTRFKDHMLPYVRVAQLFYDMGLVVGGNNHDAICDVRREAENAWLLIPGAGAQEAPVSSVVPSALRQDGSGILINAGRSIFKASDPAEAAQKLVQEINQCR